MDSKFKGRIISALRRLSYSWPPLNAALKLARRDLSTYECAHCHDYIYDGDSDKTLKNVCSRHSRTVRKGKLHKDHIAPIIPLEGFKLKIWDWNEYISRMYCEINGIQILCEKCHQIKTDNEKSIRKDVRKINKALDKE